MVTKKTMRFCTTPFLWFLLVAITSIMVGLCNGCDQIERDALLKFKSGLIDNANRLASWTDDATDCCRWYKVICDNFTGNVIELHLAAYTWEEYTASSAAADHAQYYDRSTFRGNISESLQNLKHLKYLDLSGNSFGGIPIPEFFGSMMSLTHLKLFRAGFEGIPPQLGNLTDLKYLDLNSQDRFVSSLGWISNLKSLEFLDLSGMDISYASDWFDSLNKLPSLVELHLSGSPLYPISLPFPSAKFPSLKILDLSYSYNNNLEILLPYWIFHLRNLTSLDLTGNNYAGPIIPFHLQNITTLRELRMSHSNIDSSIFNSFHGFSNLELLDLNTNNLKGRIPNSIGHLTSLKSLDLSYNNLEGEIPIAIGNLTSLNTLILGFNSFNGEIPSVIGNITSLGILDLFGNSLTGKIPASFKNLCDLRFLDLTSNTLNQEINEIIEILSACPSNSVEHLIFAESNLSGHFTNHIGKLKNLIQLNLNDNSIVGLIPESIGELKLLKELDLGNNKLNGTLPIGFGKLEKLENVEISGNSLEGNVSEVHFTNLTNLLKFVASGNHLALRVKPDWVPPFQKLTDIDLQQWQIGRSFPSWLRFLNLLQHINLSNTKISSTVPLWFLNLNFSKFDINLSDNQMHGHIPYINITSIISIYSIKSYIDLSSNHFEGPLPSFISSDIQVLDLSNNSFSGPVIKFFCENMLEPKALEVLNLGDNLLSGGIPDCWKNWKELQALKVGNNNFRSRIPKTIGTLSHLKFLSLQNNNLFGEIPSSLANCKNLIVLDLRNNELEGDISKQKLDQFSNLAILSARGNNFHSHISQKFCKLTSLQILDLSDNVLTGSIPNCINDLRGMSTEGFSDLLWTIQRNMGAVKFVPSSAIMRKGAMAEYTYGLSLVRSFDLSNNKLSGEIPEGITSLFKLQSLNLSHNLLTGKIPIEIGNISTLESLDLSENQLVGKIPQSMTTLTFLSVLNLSNNELSGMIPSSTQLQSFDPSSFRGNRLCGPPVSQNCSENLDMEDEATEGDGKGDGEVDWFYFYVSIAPGFVIGFWGVVGPLVFNRKWRILYFNFLKDLWRKICV